MPMKKSSLSVSTNFMYIHLSYQIYGHLHYGRCVCGGGGGGGGQGNYHYSTQLNRTKGRN